MLGGVKGHGAKAVSSRSGGQWGRPAGTCTDRPDLTTRRRDFCKGSEASVQEMLLEA